VSQDYTAAASAYIDAAADFLAEYRKEGADWPQVEAELRQEGAGEAQIVALKAAWEVGL
jgi:hypothetical protein